MPAKSHPFETTGNHRETVDSVSRGGKTQTKAEAAKRGGQHDELAAREPPRGGCSKQCDKILCFVVYNTETH